MNIWDGDRLRIESGFAIDNCVSCFPSCTVDSCGAGECSSTGHCICTSNSFQIVQGSQCDLSSVCTPPDYSNSTNLVLSSVYNSQIGSLFSTGNWEISLQFDQSKNTMRDVKVVSSGGVVCSSLKSDLNETQNWLNVQWSQNVDQNDCTDSISASLPWSQLSSCLQDQTDPTLYHGKIVTETFFSNSGYYSNNFLKRVDQDTVFTSERLFSFVFQATVTTDTNSSTFTLDYGTELDIVVNVTDSNPNTTCVVEQLAAALGVNTSVIVISNNLNESGTGIQNFTILFLDTTSNSSQSLADAALQYLSNNTLSCGNTTTITATNETTQDTASLSFQLRVVSRSFSSSDFTLVLQMSLSVSSPLIGDPNSFSVNSTLNPSTLIASETCDAQFCEQAITLTYNLSTLNCNGITETEVLQMNVACSNGTSASLCNFYMTILNGKLIEIPFVISAEWCPKTETTQISTSYFQLASNGTQLSNGDSLTTSRTIDAEILVTVDSKVTGTSLSTASVSQLILSDGISAYLLASNEFSQNFIDNLNNITFQFSHLIDPAQIPLNFTQPLSYIATIQVSFLPNSKRKQVGRANNGESISLKLQSTLFKFPSNKVIDTKPPAPSPSTPSTPPQDPNISSSKNKTLPIVIGVVASVCGIIVVALIFVIVRRRSKKRETGNFNRQKDDDDIPL